MESPNKKSPSVWFNELRGLLTLIFQKVSKLVDRVLFDKKGSVIISLVLSIMICVVINYEDISLKLFNDTRTTVDLRNVAVEVLADTDKYDVPIFYPVVLLYLKHLLLVIFISNCF